MAEQAEGNPSGEREATGIVRQAEAVLREPARERLEMLLHAPQPMRLVRALPDGDLYLTVREVGPHDALPLMALASASQIQHLMDLEAWRGDRFDAARAGAWVALLLEAGEPTLVRFLRNADDELLELLIARWMRVHQIEIEDTPSPHGHGETEAGVEEGFLSPDGWHRFAPALREQAPAVRRVAEILMQLDPARYERMVRDAIWEMPSELEERELHWRNSRLEEHGFPPLDEAQTVFAAPTGARGRTDVPSAAREGALAGPRAILRIDGERGTFAAAVDLLDTEARERILFECAAVANRILVADQADTGDPAAHGRVARAVAGFLEIALALRAVASADDAASVLREVPILELFREGYAPASDLRERARKLVRSRWPTDHPRALEFLDAPLRASLAALLLRRPAFFDAAARSESEAQREFRSPAEIEQTRDLLDLVDLVGRVAFEVLGWRMEELLPVPSKKTVIPRTSALLLTSLVRFVADGTLAAGPVPRETMVRVLAETASFPDRIDAYAGALVARAGADTRARRLLTAFLQNAIGVLHARAGDERKRDDGGDILVGPKGG